MARDSFKGTYSAAEVAAAIAAGVNDGGRPATQLPVADGGEGTFDALCRSLRASPVTVDVVNSWGEPLQASIGLAADGTAVVEVAQASGLSAARLSPADAMAASTYGMGLMVTTSFLDAPRVFGPQKGADPATVKLLEERLAHLSASYPRNPSGVPRIGAAGGLSGGLWAHFGADLVSGADAVLDAAGFDALLESADAVVVGEGRLDSQTGEGKIISAILERVRNSGRQIPVIAVVGSVAEDLGDYAENFADVLIATDAVAMRAAGKTIAAL
ncbi:glycerate kinase [Arthrobacter sp. R4]|uniref:glycerate kinase n=1 Tax=Arthrobacter sp. R4 TaxID=644417 RepID=UPI003EDAEF17